LSMGGSVGHLEEIPVRLDAECAEVLALLFRCRALVIEVVFGV
jgi:hypothetical protein